MARAVEVLLNAPSERIAGEAFNCYDLYVHEHRVASPANELCGSSAEILGESSKPKHEIQTGKLRALGMAFGGEHLLRRTVRELVEA